MNKRKGVNTDGGAGGEELGGVEREETLMRTYYVRKQIYCQ